MSNSPKKVPPRVDAVLSNACVVQPGDTAVSIAARETGDPARYSELVGANAHKTLIDASSLEFATFASLQDGERLNVPVSWGRSAGVVGVTPPVPKSQLEANSEVLAGAIHAAAAAFPDMIKAPPATELSGVSMVVASWWPYLKNSWNNAYWVPDIDAAKLNAWLGIGQPMPSIQNVAAFHQIVQSAKRFWEQFKVVPSWSWDAVDWLRANQSWSSVSRPGDIPALLDLGTKVTQSSVSQAARQTTYWLPNLTTVDWSKPPYTDIVEWLKDGNNDPGKIPWDLMLNTGTTDCLLNKNPGRLAAMQADQECFTLACAGDPAENFARMACADTYTPGWCHDLAACKQVAGCKAQHDSCAQSRDCCGSLTCQDGKCEPPAFCMTQDSPCGTGSTCCPGLKCVQGRCAAQAAEVSCGLRDAGCDASHPCCVGLECDNGKCVSKYSTTVPTTEFDKTPAASTSTWAYVLGALAVGAMAVGGYALLKPTKGAKQNPMGRREYRGPQTFAGRIGLRRLPLNSGGYTRFGEYFGIGAPLYEFDSDDGEISGVLRAHTRKEAIAKVKAQYPYAKVW